MATTAAALLNTPNSQAEFDIWAFSLNANIREIQQAIFEQKGERLPALQLYPVPLPALDQWLQRVGDALDQICGAVGIAAVDVENIDIEDDRERQRLANSVFFEVQQARQMLRI